VNVLADFGWLVDDTALNGWQKLLILAQAELPETPPDCLWALLANLMVDPINNTDRRQWLGRSHPLVTAYLTERLAPPEDLATVLREILQIPATLYLTRTHVDVVFTLEDIRLDVRLAGLDRDPGWVPELARAIAFHYE
jgi:hypothetical protein